MAIVKPDGVSGNYTEQIKGIILESGFIIIREKMLQLNEETVLLFYAEHSERSFFPDLVSYMARYLLFHLSCDISTALIVLHYSQLESSHT